MKTDIPKARDLIKDIIIKLNNMDDPITQAWRLREEVLPLMTRQVQKVPAHTTARKITDEIIYAVLDDYELEPDISHRARGRRFGIDGGRVSEILNGVRVPTKPRTKGDGMNEIIRDQMLSR